MRNRTRWIDERDEDRQRYTGRDANYGDDYRYPALDEHYRMYRDWNDNSHYGSRDQYTPPNDGRAGYLEYIEPDERSRTRISTYGYRNVGDRSNYGHSGTNDPYDPQNYDRGRNMYGMGADSYMNARRDEEMRYDSRNDWYTQGRNADPDRERRYREEDDIARVHYDVGMNERNTSTWTGDEHMYRSDDEWRRWEERRRY